MVWIPGGEFSMGSADPTREICGGSFLCTDLYCTLYWVGSRGKGEPDSSACHTGFRCVKSPSS
jgi:formylglycine-generating enzyme required for sulfatase activity